SSDLARLVEPEQKNRLLSHPRQAEKRQTRRAGGFHHRLAQAGKRSGNRLGQAGRFGRRRRRRSLSLGRRYGTYLSYRLSKKIAPQDSPRSSSGETFMSNATGVRWQSCGKKTPWQPIRSA